MQWRAQDLAPNLERWLDGNKGPEFLLPRSLLDPALRWLNDYPDELAGPAAGYIQASKRRRTRRRSLITGAVAVLVVASLTAAGIYSLQQPLFPSANRRSAAERRGLPPADHRERNPGRYRSRHVQAVERRGMAHRPLQRRPVCDAGRCYAPRDRGPHRPRQPGATRWRSARTAGPWPAGGDGGDARAAVGRGHPPADRRPAHRPRPDGRGGVQPGRRDPGQRRRRRHGAAVGRGHPPADRRPAHRPRRPGHAVAFSPDGKTLATGGDDGPVRLWDVATRRPVGARSPLANGRSP